VIIPDWPVPPEVRSLLSLREGGVSRAPFDSLNLGDHVGDDPAAVAENRRRYAAASPRLRLRRSRPTPPRIWP